jgi:hypothetical protein
LKIERSVCTTSRTVPGARVCERSVTHACTSDVRTAEPPTAESGSGNVVVDHRFDPSHGGRAMRTGCGPLLRVLGNGYWILVVDVAPTTRALAAIGAAYYARGEVREAKRASTTARGPSTACTSPPEDRIAGFWWTPWRTVAGSIRLPPWRFDGRQGLPKHLQRDDVDPRFKKGTRRSLSPDVPDYPARYRQDQSRTCPTAGRRGQRCLPLQDHRRGRWN